MKKRLPIIVTVVVVIGLLMFTAHTFDLIGFARSVHGG
jgi:uncharacterized protein YxeA